MNRGQVRLTHQLQQMSHSGIRRVVRTVNLTLDTPRRSIAHCNLNIIFKAIRTTILVSVTVKSSLFTALTTRRPLVQEIRRWCSTTLKETNVQVLVQLNIVPAAMPSVRTTANTTGRDGYRGEEEFL